MMNKAEVQLIMKVALGSSILEEADFKTSKTLRYITLFSESELPNFSIPVKTSPYFNRTMLYVNYED